MKRGRFLICVLFVVCQLVMSAPAVHALGSQNIVIAQMYPGSTGVATQEFVELYNNGASAVDVSNWCLYYVSSTGLTTTKLGCLTAPDNSTRLWVKGAGYITFASNEYKTAAQATSDVAFVGGISATAGHVRLYDSSNTEIDRLGWGTAANPETAAAAALANGKSLQRKSSGTVYQDTDNNNSDFDQMNPVFHHSDVYEVVTIVDVCQNISGVQPTMPTGYLADSDGDCQPDSCLNLDGLQVSVPDNYDADANGNCTIHIVPLVLNELLSNAIGSDTGNEFIEIYNPTGQTIDLSQYSIKIGVNADKTYAFPIGATIASGEYRTFSDSVMKFSLVNTIGRVVLTASNGSTLGDSGVYDSPAEGESWALFGGIWQYTNRPTPGSENMISESEPVDVTDNGATCPAGKYRNPLTNRCRSIVTDAAVLAVCDSDQYRNPETGRCRKITTTTLTPCKDGQYRSEETGRCRNIVVASTQKPCKDSQYRSEETGRCRNLPVGTVPNAAYAVQPVKDTGNIFVGWWALGGAGLLAGGYGVWEWRREILQLWQHFIKR